MLVVFVHWNYVFMGVAKNSETVA